MRWLLIAESILGLVASGAFVVLYGLGSTEWRRYPIGRNLIAKGLVLFALFALSLLSYLVIVPGLVWALVGGALDLVLVWRVVITWRVQHNGEPEASRPRG